MAEFTIYIGNKNYSSWSLRAWLALEATGRPYEEVVIPLYVPGSKAAILRQSPSGKVPALRHGQTIVWESLAIAEYLAEICPAARLWPEAAEARAIARAVSAEMHGGFTALRRHLPMNLRRQVADHPLPPEVIADIDRIAALWSICRERFGAGGPFLFGAFTIPDAMFAPVVGRFHTYGVRLDGTAQTYAAALWAYPPLRRWCEAAERETMRLPQFEV